MIKVLILYYLSLKQTHGYEIQKFIQINHMDSWTKIQSGSIYYALSKLEKEGLIELVSEESIGAKVRKIYAITSKGRSELDELVREELNHPLYESGSDKFILYPLLAVSNKEEIERVVSLHLKELEKKKETLRKWQDIKLNDDTLEVERLSFEMMLSNIEYQMKWHQALLSQLDRCIENSKTIAKLITSFDFSDSEVVAPDQVKNLDSLRTAQKIPDYR